MTHQMPLFSVHARQTPFAAVRMGCVDREPPSVGKGAPATEHSLLYLLRPSAAGHYETEWPKASGRSSTSGAFPGRGRHPGRAGISEHQTAGLDQEEAANETRAQEHEGRMKDREQLIANLQAAFPLVNQLQMGTLAYLIERALGRSPKRRNSRCSCR